MALQPARPPVRLCPEPQRLPSPGPRAGSAARLLLLQLLLGVASLCLPGAARANQRDPRLPGLFQQLARASTELRAAEIESEIWQLWSDSGSDEVNRLLERGTSAMNRGDLDEAIALFGRITELAPDFSEGWNKRATAYYQKGDYEASIRDVEVVLRLEPRHFAALSGMGLMYTEMAADAPALYWFQRALRVHPFMRGLRERVEELRHRRDRDRT